MLRSAASGGRAGAEGEGAGALPGLPSGSNGARFLSMTCQHPGGGPHCSQGRGRGGRRPRPGASELLPFRGLRRPPDQVLAMRPSWGAGAAFCFVLLSWASGPSPVKMEYNLGFWPPQLSKAEGENATFVCNVSRELMTSILNWYKEKNGSQPEKLAAYPKDKPSSPLQDRYHIAKRNGQTYEMTIVGLQLNDSGRYFCGIINFQMPPVKESGWSELNVTERLMDSTTPTPFTTPEALEKFPRIIVVVSIIVGAVLVLLLLCWVLFIVESRGRGGAGNSESDKDSLKVERCAASGSASAVVYGQLDFQRPEAPPAGGAECCEQTEYAIIVFPPDKPGGSPHRK